MGELGRHLFAKILKATASDGNFEDIMAECLAKDTKYEDESFPAAEESLIADWSDPDVQDKVRMWSQFDWRRANDIKSLKDESKDGKVHLFYDKIEPSDIKQGMLGDCYFLSVLAGLAEQPHRIKRLFINDRENKFGVYGVRICKNGEWKEVVVDDRFPCYRGDPAFSNANGDELWVLILEKAWAKLHGSYERIEAGFAENVFHDLTGAPTKVFENDDENLWEELQKAEANQWLMAASAGSTNASKSALEQLGLMGNHAYSVLKVIEVEDRMGDKVQLIQLRNPWGCELEWTGDWSDDDACWTQKLKD